MQKCRKIQVSGIYWENLPFPALGWPYMPLGLLAGDQDEYGSVVEALVKN